jgi:hypothetical protein
LADDGRTTLIGWHGIFVRVPSDWKLGAVGGDGKSGYLRVDDERMPRLQLRWTAGRIDLKKKREEYAKRLERGRRRRPTGLVVDLDAKVLSARSKPKKDMLGFAWRGAQCGMGVLWNCETCGRGLIAQVSWAPEERMHEVAREVLASLEDHDEGGWRAWALDGLAFLAPQTYQLGKWRWLTGYLEMNFQEGRRMLKVARWGMVPQLLGGASLDEWYRRQSAGRRDIRPQAEGVVIKDHEGVAAWGALRGLGVAVRALALRAIRRKPVNQFAAVAWHCPESNRLYQVETIDAGEGTTLEGVVESIACHREAEA